MNRIRCTFLIAWLGLWPASAFAHAGHLGELAGHGHWIGVTAVLGAAVLGAAAAKLRGNSASVDESDGAEEEAGPVGDPEPAEG